MNLYTDNVSFASGVVENYSPWERAALEDLPGAVRPFLEALVQSRPIFRAQGTLVKHWDHLVLVNEASESQFDILNALVRTHTNCSESLLCLAGVGKNFHGFKNRPWQTAPGNLHLSALVSPHATINHAGVAFTVLAVVSILQTLDDLTGVSRSAGVKWVNDILIGDSKIGGVLASAQIQGDVVTQATMGIGLNIEKAPDVSPTPFVPTVGCLHQFSTEGDRCTLRLVFQRLITYLGANYRSLLAGGYPRLLESYRSRSIVLGRRVRLHRDTVDSTPGELLEGVVTSIGDDLQLFIDDAPSPVFTGRLELLSD